MDGPRMWKTTKVISPFFAASMKPMLRSASKVGDKRPARTSIKLTVASVELTVSKIRIWSGTSEADAIRMANDSHYGLAAYIWSHDLGRALRAAHAIEAGWGQVNQGLGQSPGHSYGGFKKKGNGREVSPQEKLER